MSNNRDTRIRLAVSIIAVIVLFTALSVSTFALIFSMVSVDGNIFSTSTVSININDGKPVITEDDELFAPGTTVKKEFFIKNESTCDVYYKLYFSNVSGDLADYVYITICDGDNVLYYGRPKNLERDKSISVDTVLKVNEKRSLQIYFELSSSVENEGQGRVLVFDLAADAVQAKNNDDKLFE